MLKTWLALKNCLLVPESLGETLCHGVLLVTLGGIAVVETCLRDCEIQ
jgi:hypothetical protein